MDDSARAIGVFDSGVGGLTVLAALRAELPHEQFVYLGDTARLPYGTKSPETVVRYALQAADALIERGVKALIVACNTASAVALPSLRQRYEDLPVIGVVEPGADAAVAATRSGCIAVIGTEATVRGGAYQRAIAERRPGRQRPGARLPGVRGAGGRGLDRRRGRPGHGAALPGAAVRARCGAWDPRAADTLVLGCTHFPVLRPVIREVIGERVSIVDSAATTARAARAAAGRAGPAARAGRCNREAGAVAVPGDRRGGAICCDRRALPGARDRRA